MRRETEVCLAHKVLQEARVILALVVQEALSVHLVLLACLVL